MVFWIIAVKKLNEHDLYSSLYHVELLHLSTHEADVVAILCAWALLLHICLEEHNTFYIGSGRAEARCVGSVI